MSSLSGQLTRVLTSSQQVNEAVERTVNESQALATFIEHLHTKVKGSVGSLSGDCVVV